MLLASASNAVIIGFNVRPERKAQELAEQEKVDIRLHSIIYELQDEMKRAMTGLLEPIIKETYLGRAEVRDTFRIPKVGTMAGCQVIDGVIKRDSEVRLLRDNVVVFKGKIGSLRRFKDDVKEVTQRHGVWHLASPTTATSKLEMSLRLCHRAGSGRSLRLNELVELSSRNCIPRARQSVSGTLPQQDRT